MATFRSALRGIAPHYTSPSQALEQLNKVIYPDIREDMFISAIYAHLDHQSGKVSLARAGHNPAYYFKNESQEIHKVKPPGLAVGIDPGLVFGQVLRDHEIEMNSGDSLLLYTDGIIEAFNQHKEEFSSARLEDIVQNHGGAGARELGKIILDEVANFVQGAPQSDDITLVVIEKL